MIIIVYMIHWYTDTIWITIFFIVGHVPVIEHKRRKVGALPEYWLIIPWLWARGAGILNVMALWNFRRRGSTVTTGDTATPLPRSFAVRSGSIGCA